MRAPGSVAILLFRSEPHLWAAGRKASVLFQMCGLKLRDGSAGISAFKNYFVVICLLVLFLD